MSTGRRVALVTGSGRGIGAAVLTALAGDHDCVVHARQDRASAASIAAAVERAGARALVVTADLGEADDVARLADAALERFGRVDTLVANAAATTFRPLADAAGRHSRRTFATAVDSLVELVHRCAPAMGEGGRIVVVSGLDARFAQAGHGLLGGAKAALEALARSWAVELGPRGITANAVVPGPVDTDSLQMYLRDRVDLETMLVDHTPAGRLARPADVAALVAFLCSPAAAMISGQTIAVDGGMSAQGGPWALLRDLW